MQAPAGLSERAGNVKLLVLDADGVLTDGRIYLAEAGGTEWSMGFSVRDGYGIRRLLEAGVEVAVISGRDSHGLRLRLSELGIRRTALRCKDKRAALISMLEELQLSPDQAAFVGDDIPDLSAMREVRLAVAVAGAHPDVRSAAHWITSLEGGCGAVREVCDFLLGAMP